MHENNFIVFFDYYIVNNKLVSVRKLEYTITIIPWRTSCRTMRLEHYAALYSAYWGFQLYTTCMQFRSSNSYYNSFILETLGLNYIDFSIILTTIFTLPSTSNGIRHTIIFYICSNEYHTDVIIFVTVYESYKSAKWANSKIEP